MPVSIRSLTSTRTNSIRSIVERFHESRAGSRLSLNEYWDSLRGDRSITLLAALIKADLQQRFQAGERPTAAEYFERFPDLVVNNDHTLSLVYEEFCLLEDHQANPSVGDFCLRYAPWRDSLISQLGYHREFSQIVGADRSSVVYPAVGSRFATYQLNSLLGEGGTAQVYLATDDLGGRQVVLKVSSTIGQEPSILAQLEHRHIVPILTVAESPESGLRGICMPYRPGVTLETVLQRISAGSMPRRARFLTDLLAISPEKRDDEESNWEDFPRSGTYTEAVAWIGVAMAKALAYLHSKKIYHRDIKPANILLAYKEGPLLFDFNLAHSPSDPVQARAALKGGTLPYMAPEQLKAFLDPQFWDSVAGPADIYALGLVLRELVTGRKPDLPRVDLPLAHAIKDLHDRRHEQLVSIRVTRPEIPPSLDAIILRCLAINPADRYATATELCLDLQRFLKRQPLAFAANQSRLEVTINWIYRRRKLVVVAGLVVAVALALLPNLQQKAELTQAVIQEGIVLLNSSSPREWRRARDHYLRLVREYPDEASPLLFLGLTYHRIGMDDLGKQSLGDAFSKKNVEMAIRLGLRSDPRSIPLKFSLAVYYFEVKSDPIMARNMAREVLKLDPNHYGAYELLGTIGHSTDNEQAIRDYQKAIQLALQQDDPRGAYRICRFLTPALLDELQSNLDGSPDANRLRKATRLVDLIDEQIELLAKKLWTKASPTDSDLDLALTYTRGVRMSGAAYIRCLGGDCDRQSSVEEFRQVRTEFQRILELTRREAKSNDLNRRNVASGLQNYCLKQLIELDRRAYVCHLDKMLSLGQIHDPTH